MLVPSRYCKVELPYLVCVSSAPWACLKRILPCPSSRRVCIVPCCDSPSSPSHSRVSMTRQFERRCVPKATRVRYAGAEVTKSRHSGPQHMPRLANPPLPESQAIFGLLGRRRMSTS
ncbi:hypothetical protein LIA77_05323 [Sarocladium implicatum]|nr:hypothetical protein LIA77_05323 [Sarocladium implicatum]